jgi:hypothetical protein
MKTHALTGIIVASLALGLSIAARADDERHSPDAHMDQNSDRYRYTYDDGICRYEYQYDFKELTDHLDQHGDCRNVPIQRYRPQAAIAPVYPPPAAAPPAAMPAPPAGVVVTPGSPPPPVSGPSGITVTPVR